jgi:hypothetical protein
MSRPRLLPPPALLLLPLLLLPLLLPRPAWAHDADILYVEAREGAAGRVEERLTLTAGSLLLLAPVDASGDGAVDAAELAAGADALVYGVWEQAPLRAGGRPCVREATGAEVHEGFLALSATFRCPEGERKQTFRLLSVLPAGYRVVLGRQGAEGATGHAFAQGALQTLTLPGGAAGGAAPGGGGEGRGFGGWVVLGVQHILEGYDHLAFLLAVLLVGGGARRALLLVTSFTLAHSLTLATVALGWVVLDGGRARWVEAAIALSVMVVAAENLLLRAHRHRALLTFLFGLVHGFGFAGVLGAYGLGRGVARALLGFNLGVELGQAAVVLAVVPLVAALGRRPVLAHWTVRGVSGLIFLLGAGWMVQRVAG